MEVMICTPLDSASVSFGTRVNQVSLTYSIKDSRTPMRSTVVAMDSTMPRILFTHPRVASCMIFSSSLPNRCMHRHVAMIIRINAMIFTIFSEALTHWPSQSASSDENLPARMIPMKSPAIDSYEKSRYTAYLADQSVLKSLYYCQCEQYKDDNVNNSHNEQN